LTFELPEVTAVVRRLLARNIGKAQKFTPVGFIWRISVEMSRRMGVSLKPLPAPAAREDGDLSPATICHQIFDSISVHANGDIVCWGVDSQGQRVYGNVFTDRIVDVYNGPAYREIRDWMLRSRADTWCPAVERHCPLRVVPASVDQDAHNCRIKILKLEPVTYCNLRCPVCPVETAFKQIPALKETRAQKLLALETMLDVVAHQVVPETNIFGFGGEKYHEGVAVLLAPAWFVSIGSGMVSLLLCRAKTVAFTVRNLLIATALVAAILGLVVYPK